MFQIETDLIDPQSPKWECFTWFKNKSNAAKCYTAWNSHSLMTWHHQHQGVIKKYILNVYQRDFKCCLVNICLIFVQLIIYCNGWFLNHWMSLTDCWIFFAFNYVELRNIFPNMLLCTWATLKSSSRPSRLRCALCKRSYLRKVSQY